MFRSHSFPYRSLLLGSNIPNNKPIKIIIYLIFYFQILGFWYVFQIFIYLQIEFLYESNLKYSL